MTKPIVFVIDDDEDTRESVRSLVESVGLQVKTCESAESFLRGVSSLVTGCVVLEVRMRDMSGLDLHESLIADGHTIPVIFLTAHADVQVVVRSMKTGAFDFFEKPYRAQALLERIQQAIAQHRAVQKRRRSMHDVVVRLGLLTSREREVAALVVEGLTSKQIAARLDLSPKTIHAHRAEAMAKLQARSVADLTRIIVSARLLCDHPACALEPSGGVRDDRPGAQVPWTRDQRQQLWGALR